MKFYKQQIKVNTAERLGLDIISIAEFMDDFNKSLVIDTKLIYVLDNRTNEWIETLVPVKFKCSKCKELGADVIAFEMEFMPECPYCQSVIRL